MDSAWMVKER